METLFSHLSSRFVVQRENLVTEGLAYILQRSGAARSALIDLLWEGRADAPSALHFRTQALAADGAIPDLIGVDSEGRTVLLGEAKFWSGLTTAQPVKYIHRLEGEGGGILAIIAPQQRLHPLWHELRLRCERASIEVRDPSAVREGLLTNTIDPGGKLVMVSWRLLIGTIGKAMEAAGEEDLLSDLRQLKGLADQADADAFLPLESEDLTGSTGTRILQFVRLVQDAFSGLKATGVAVQSGQMWTNGVGNHGQYFLIHGVQARLMVRLELWGKHAFTPIWLRVGSSSYTDRQTTQIRNAVAPWREGGRRLIEEGAKFLVPIELPTGVEREQVVAAIIEQVTRFSKLLEGIIAVSENEAGEEPDAQIEGGDPSATVAVES